jgi:hypothetical protein
LDINCFTIKTKAARRNNKRNASKLVDDSENPSSAGKILLPNQAETAPLLPPRPAEESSHKHV